MAVVVAQLVQRLLPIPEVRGSNQVMGKISIEYLLTVNCIEKTEIKKTRLGMAHCYKKVLPIQSKSIECKQINK